MGKKSGAPREGRFVVDLPDGQKLYVGELEEGVALEVATWRGVGEPDSRVARMIIAASRTDASATSSRETPPQAVLVEEHPRAEENARGSQLTKKARYQAAQPRRGLTLARRALSGIVAIPIAAAVTAILTGTIALAQPVPSLAAELEIGASSLFVALPKGEYAAGDEVLARVSSNSNQAAVVAQVVSVTDDSVTIATGGTLIELAKSQVIGELVGTLPVGADLVDRPLLAAAMAAALILGLLLFAL